MPIAPRRRDYGAVDAHGVFQWRAPALDTEEDCKRDYKIWERSLAAGIKRFEDYTNNGEFIFHAIRGQVEPSLWDKTRADVRFAAVQALNCPIALIILIKERSIGTQSGIWAPMALISHLQKTVQHKQNPVWEGSTSIGDFKREVESHVSTAVQLGGKLAFGSAIMEPILADGD